MPSQTSSVLLHPMTADIFNHELIASFYNFVWITAYERCFPNALVRDPQPSPSEQKWLCKALGAIWTTSLKQPRQTSAFTITEARLTTYTKTIMCALLMLSSLCITGIWDSYNNSSDTKMKLWGASILIKPQGKMIRRNHHHAVGSIPTSTTLKSLLH